VADPGDRLFAIVANVPANGEMPLGSGTYTIAGVNPANQLSFYFDVLEKVHPAP
jgi:hypothetical protein